MHWLFESKRLRFRKLEDEDFYQVCEALKDPEVMRAW